MLSAFVTDMGIRYESVGPVIHHDANSCRAFADRLWANYQQEAASEPDSSRRPNDEAVVVQLRYKLSRPHWSVVFILDHRIDDMEEIVHVYDDSDEPELFDSLWNGLT